MKNIHVEPPSSDARRDRVERRVFEQLAAVRVLERTDAVLPVERPSRRRWLVPAGAFALAAAAAAVFVLGRGGEAPVEQASVPSRIVTPVGGASRFSIGEEAVIDAGSDTSVEVQHVAGGGITLVLARGSVDCDVAPRAGRAPFRVVAGDVQVEVVGTRFTVAKTLNTRVDVARGKVKVFAPGGSWLVAAGESWPAVQAAVEPPAPATEADPIPVEVIAPAPAAKLKKVDPNALFDHIDQAKDPVAAADAFLKQFPHHVLVEEVTYKRIEALEKAGRVTEARRAAAEYLKQFPHGTYVEVVSTIAAQK